MTKKMKTLCLALCGTAVLGLSAFATIKIQNANAETELIVPQEYVIEEEYIFGETLNVPAPSSVRIKTGLMETTAVSVVLRCPDGTAKSEGIYTLDKTGHYELTYYNANGVSATQKFVVNKNVYGAGEGVTANFSQELVGASNKDGIEVTLKDGSSFSFNQIINLNDYVGGELEVCKIFPMFRDTIDVAPTAHTVSVKIVDYYDSSKFVEYYIWCGEAGQNPYYAGAGASTQNLTGLEQNRHRPQDMTEEYEGELYKVHRPQRYQSKTAWGVGMACGANDKLLKDDGITLIWDLSNHQMRAQSANVVLITDIDSTEIYGVNAFDFASFFTTGDVYLNIEAYNYEAGNFEFGLESIFGMRGDALKNVTLVDEKAPEIVMDVEPTDGNRIYLEKGKTVQLPQIKEVFDYNYYGKTRLEVYRNYGKYGQALLNIENGEFTPNALGNYTAVYTAVDSYGNEGKYLLELVVLEEKSITYTQTAMDKLVAAKVNVLPKISAVGINAPVEISVFVTAPNGEYVELRDDGGNGYEYIPEYAGEYTVSYLFKDNVYEETYSYKVQCVDEKSAIFQKAFALPAYFIKGASYSIAPVTAYTAGDGQFKENKATVSVSVDGGAYTTLSDKQMQEYKVEANQTLRFKASFGTDFVESAVYSVVDVGYGKKTSEKTYAAYWQGNYTSAAMTLSGAEYTFSGDAKVQFINLISSANFNMNFKVQAENAESVGFTLRDARDPNHTYVTYTYEKQMNANLTLRAQQYVDGRLVLDKSVPTKLKTLSGDFSLEYSSLGMTSGDVLLEGVQAFVEDNALIEIFVNGATAGCGVTISKLNYQAFSSALREGKPQLKYTESNGVQERNSVYTISPCHSSAVLSPVLFKDVTLTVYAPDGKVAKSVDGVALEKVTADKSYNLKLKQIGQYRVIYEAACLGSTRNGTEMLQDSNYYIINVSEGVPPTIRFKDGSNEYTTVKLEVGSTHKVKEYTVKDNVTATKNIKVCVMILGKDFALEENGYDVTSYTFINKGEFIVYVLAYDEQGNSSAIYYNVVVS